MEKKIQKNEYITLQDAARICPHSQEYLSLRARQGRLKAVKIGRNWSTTKEWLQEYIENEYFTLQEATKLCAYTQEYLSLRARQGRLKAVKIGRNWSTTKEWLQEYINQSEDYKKSVEEKRNGAEQPESVDAIEEKKEISVAYEQKELILPEPPANLPVEESIEELWKRLVVASLQEKKQRVSSLWKLGFVLYLLIFVLSLSDIQFGRNHLYQFYQNLNPPIYEFSEGFDVGVGILGSAANVRVEMAADAVVSMGSTIPESVEQFGEGFDVGSRIFVREAHSRGEELGEGFAYGIRSPIAVRSSVNESLLFVNAQVVAFSELVGEGTQIFAKRMWNDIARVSATLQNNIEQGIASGAQSLARAMKELAQELGRDISSLVQKEDGEEQKSMPLPKPVKQGLVVVPSSPEDEQVKQQIKESFSDEVQVSPHDDESGIITPVFRERKGEDYLYILVPLQDVQ